MPDFTWLGPWARLKFRAPCVKIEVHNVGESHGMGYSELLKDPGEIQGQSPWWGSRGQSHWKLYNFMAFLSANSLPKLVKNYFFLVLFSHDFGRPGSQALGPGPTGPVVNPVLTDLICNLIRSVSHKFDHLLNFK